MQSRGLILTGAGPKAFVAGADIAELAAVDRQQGVEMAAHGSRVFRQIEQLPKPVIAAVNGFALGGGCELAMACHLRLAAPNARFAQPEVKLGLIPGFGGTVRLPRLVGRGRALELLLTGSMIDADEAARIGLVNRVVPAASLLDEARALMRTMLAQGPLARRLCLQAVDAALDLRHRRRHWRSKPCISATPAPARTRPRVRGRSSRSARRSSAAADPVRAIGLVVRSFRNLADAAIELPEVGRRTGRAERPWQDQPARGAGISGVVPLGTRCCRPGSGALRRTGISGGHQPERRVRRSRRPISRRERRKRITIDGEDQTTVAAAIGRWLAVGFFPTDLALVQGGAAERRRWLDRMLSLADRTYLDALLRYRGALAQRNAALRAQDIAAAERIRSRHWLAPDRCWHRRRRAWVAAAGEQWQAELAGLGESAAVTLRYKGDDALDDVAAWDARLSASCPRDLARGQTHVGPHRDDLVLGLGGHALRHYGSTGQQRTAAMALRLLELETLASARGVRPALLVDDVFAELDHDRQRRLATRLVSRPGQRIVTAPRAEEIPRELDLPRWEVQDGMIRQVFSEAA